MLIAVEDLLKKEKPFVMIVEKLAQGPKFNAKGNFFKKKGSQGYKYEVHDNKENKWNGKASKGNYFYHKKPGY